VSSQATAADERPIFLAAAGETIFAVHTRPGSESHGTYGSGAVGVILLQGGSWTPSPGRNRLWVDLARDLAGWGCHALRLDYRGVGESSGHIDNYNLDTPFVEEVVAAADYLRGEGIDRLVLLGTCFGARTAMAAASEVKGLVGVGLFPAPVREFQMGHRMASLPFSWLARRALSTRAVTGLLDPKKRQAYLRIVRKKLDRALHRARRRTSPGTDRPAGRFQWVSPLFVEQLAGLVARRNHVLLVFGDDDDFYQDFLKGRTGPLGAVLDRGGSRVQVVEVEGRVHGLTSVEVQCRVREVVERWFHETVGGSTDGPAHRQPTPDAAVIGGPRAQP
jgi:pimeloyl-ACP methyl ester carboxylesterase